MSRVAKSPVAIPTKVEVVLGEGSITVKGPKGTLTKSINKHVSVTKTEDKPEMLVFKPSSEHSDAWKQAGTARSIINGMVIGVSEGFTKTLELVGVGYRAQAKGNILSLSLGFSHPVDFKCPEGIEIETPSNTSVIIKGIDKQKVGQVAAEIRSKRPPEPYKGKGVRYSGEQIVRKEAKKK